MHNDSYIPPQARVSPHKAFLIEYILSSDNHHESHFSFFPQDTVHWHKLIGSQHFWWGDGPEDIKLVFS